MGVDLSTYGGLQMAVGYPGQTADANSVISESKSNESATTIDFGVMVARGAADDTCKPISADGDKIAGFSMRHATKVANSDGTVTYAQYDAVPIGKEGYFFATAYENATRGDVAISVTAQAGKLGSTTGGAAGAGRIAMDGTGGKPLVTWEGTVTAGQVGKVRVTF